MYSSSQKMYLKGTTQSYLCSYSALFCLLCCRFMRKNWFLCTFHSHRGTGSHTLAHSCCYKHVWIIVHKVYFM